MPIYASRKRNLLLQQVPRGGIAPILQRTELHIKLRKGLERESDLNYLGWAILILFRADRKNGWLVIKDLDLSFFARELQNIASPEMIRQFLLNLKRVSRLKGAEFLQQCDPEVIARSIESMSLGNAGSLLALIRFFSTDYLERVTNLLEPYKICQQVLLEGDLSDLRYGLDRFAQHLRDRICVRASSSEDAFGETLYRLTFYFDTTKVVRFLKGQRLEIPYGTSNSSLQAYWQLLHKKCRADCEISIDDGAAIALGKGSSLFPVGVTAVRGFFKRSEVIAIKNIQNRVIAFGVTNFDSAEIEEIRGMRFSEIATNRKVEPNRIMDKDFMVAGLRYQRILSDAAR
jgi:PUA domain